MVVVPINADVDEAQHVAEGHGQQGYQVRKLRPVRHLDLQHHDGEDDGQDAIAEGFESSLVHTVLVARRAEWWWTKGSVVASAADSGCSCAGLTVPAAPAPPGPSGPG